MKFITEWKEEYAADLARALNNLNVLNNLRDGLPYPYTERDAAEFIGAMLSADPNETFAFAIVYGGRCIGSISAFRQGNIHRRSAEVGYYVAEEFWGRGIATAALKELCAFVFENTDIIRLFAEPFAYNAASRRALEKAGFVEEGVLRCNAVKLGKVRDTVMYAKIKQGVKVSSIHRRA